MPSPRAAGRLPVPLVPARGSDLQLSCLVHTSRFCSACGCKGRLWPLVHCGCTATSPMQTPAHPALLVQVALKAAHQGYRSQQGQAGPSGVGMSGPGFSGSFVSVAGFSQAEFLTEISLFSPLPEAKELISLKYFSSPIDCRPCSHSCTVQPHHASNFVRSQLVWAKLSLC